MRFRRPLAFTVAAAAALGVSACSVGGHDLTVRVAAGPVAFDAPLGLAVSGADPDRPVRVTATATDTRAVRWTAHADFSPTHAGAVDVRTSPAGNGDYRGAHDTGLVWALAADDGYPQFALGDDATMTVTFTATQDGEQPVSARQSRWFRGPGIRMDSLDRAKAGFSGAMFTPAGTGAPTSAVMVLGGSEGGLSTSIPRALASRGHPALSVAYFGAPGLPSGLADVPLEYFATALRWLARQPGVDPKRITVIGASRGSEAALLLGVHYPELVHAVAATSPSSLVNPGYPDGSKPAWLLAGRPLPHAGAGTTDWYTLAPRDPRAVIPVERISGPVFLLCGDQDQLWPSCSFVDAMTRRLGTHPHTVVREVGAGHLVAFVVPNLPEISGRVTLPGRTETVGGTVQDDALGRIDAWQKLLAFLAAP